MKKKLFVWGLIIFMCFGLVGCQDTKEQEEIERIGNLINGT